MKKAKIQRVVTTKSYEETKPVCEIDLLNKKQALDIIRAVMVDIAATVTRLAQSAVDSKVDLTRIDIRYYNIPDPEKNPDGTIGHFRVTGTGTQTETIEQKDL